MCSPHPVASCESNRLYTQRVGVLRAISHVAERFAPLSFTGSHTRPEERYAPLSGPGTPSATRHPSHGRAYLHVGHL
eukprot:2879708-Prymnesium_polylepis.1